MIFIIFMIFALLRDRAKIFSIPLFLIRWTLLGLFVFTGVLLFKTGQYTLYGSIMGVILVFIFTAFGFGFMIWKYQLDTRNRIYSDWYIRFGAPSVSTHGDRVKDGLKTIRKRVKITWQGKSIDSITFQGEGGKVNISDWKSFAEYMQTMGKPDANEIYVFELEELVFGTVRAHRVTADSDEGLYYTDLVDIYNALASFVMVETYGSSFPKMEMSEWSPAVRPRFSQFTIAQQDFDRRGDHREENMLKHLTTRYPHPDKVWKLDTSDSQFVTFIAADQENPMVLKEKYGKFLNNALEFVGKRGKFLLFGTAAEVEITNKSLSGFVLEFKQGSGAHEESVQKYISQGMIAIIKKQGIPGEWKVKNKMIEEGRLYFHIQ